MIFADTNVILDVLQDDPVWEPWSSDRLAEARGEGDIVINAITVAELSRDYADVSMLTMALGLLELTIEPIELEAAFLAGHRFAAAARQRPDGERRRPLPDFFIGAHAVTLGVPLLTRDTQLYRRHFPDLTLIIPETDHG
ncbi:type II toxin-antitoxin system VapC family toxin [Sphingomonas sp.]|uniref:type II toxin-antitoxin system VapC family toxin n=1 Tax=Sphingomonas sp. TaxID=28214 RepID=UPI0035C7BB0B